MCVYSAVSNGVACRGRSVKWLNMLWCFSLDYGGVNCQDDLLICSISCLNGGTCYDTVSQYIYANV